MQVATIVDPPFAWASISTAATSRMTAISFGKVPVVNKERGEDDNKLAGRRRRLHHRCRHPLRLPHRSFLSLSQMSGELAATDLASPPISPSMAGGWSRPTARHDQHTSMAPSPTASTPSARAREALSHERLVAPQPQCVARPRSDPSRALHRSPADSGTMTRYRFNCAGDWQLNRAVYTVSPGWSSTSRPRRTQPG